MKRKKQEEGGDAKRGFGNRVADPDTDPQNF